MNLPVLLRPKWKHPDADARIEYLVKADFQRDLEIIIGLAKDDPSHDVRMAATKKIEQPKILEDLYGSSDDNEIRSLIRSRLDQEYCTELLNRTEMDETAYGLLERIRDESLLADLAVQAQCGELKHQAIDRITDTTLLARITTRNCGKTAGFLAVEAIDDPELLDRIARRASNKKVRSLASEKLQEITTENESPPSPDELRNQELKNLHDEAMRLRDSWNWDYASKTLAAARQQWRRLDPEMKHRSAEEFEEALEHFFSRLQEFRKQQSEQDRRRQIIAANVEERERIVEELSILIARPDDNALTKHADLTAAWETIELLDDEEVSEVIDRFSAAMNDFNRSRRAWEDEQEIQRVSRERLRAIIDEASTQTASDDWDNVDKALAELVAKWDEVAGPELQFPELKKQFDEIRTAFANRRQEAVDKRERESRRIVDWMESICLEMERLCETDDYALVDRRLSELQIQWENRENIQLVEKPTRTRLERRYQKARRRLRGWLGEKREQQSWENWADLTAKEELCNEVESLTGEDDIHIVFARLKDIQARWKRSGRTPPHPRAGEVNRRFRKLTDREYKRCRAFFDELDRKRQQNLLEKTSICQQIETLIDEQRWTEPATVLTEYQKKWREIGPTPRDAGHIENRFRLLCKEFFSKRRDHVRELNAQRQINLEEKSKLCETAEQLAESTDWVMAYETMKSLQTEWKAIGPAKKRDETTLWNRFKTSTDTFFKRLDERRPHHLEQKRRLVNEVRAILSDYDNANDLNDVSIREITDRIIDGQKRWKEIGPVPRENAADIWNQFTELCDRFFKIRHEFYQDRKKEHELLIKEKETLLFKAEMLEESSDWHDADEQLQQILTRWKAIGPLQSARDRSLWEAFRRSLDQFYERKRIHFNELKQEHANNFKDKEKLCLQLEMLVAKVADGYHSMKSKSLSLSEELKLAFETNFLSASTDDSNADNRWQRTLSEIQKIKKCWDETGYIPRHRERPLSKRFQDALDQFYKSRPAPNRSQSSAQLAANLEAKLAICTEVESYAAAEDPKSVVGKVKACQRRWRALGPVASKAESNRLWDRYSAACDKVFETLRADDERESRR